jgi:hypothetical protein
MGLHVVASVRRATSQAGLLFDFLVGFLVETTAAVATAL